MDGSLNFVCSMRTIIFVVFIVNQKTADTYDFVCPKTSQLHFRALSKKCTSPNKYHCLENEGSDGIVTEKCIKPTTSRFGLRPVYAGNIDFRPCKEGTYKPFSTLSNMTNTCHFTKSTCSEDGQVIFHTRSPESDVSCMCDYTNGYAFVRPPINICYCVPSKEDCSCYKKICEKDKVLSQDYNCVEVNAPFSGKECVLPKVSHGLEEHHHIIFQTLSKSCSTAFNEIDWSTEFVFKMYSFAATISLFAMFLVGACFSYKKEGIFILHSKIKSLRVVHHQQVKDVKNPRILDMCFVGTEKLLSLIYIDADNNCIVRQPLVGAGKYLRREISATNNVKRLTKVNDDLVAVAYRDQSDIVLYRILDLTKSYGKHIQDQTDQSKKSDIPSNENVIQSNKYAIQGIVCISTFDAQQPEFIISNKSILYKVDFEVGDNAVKIEKFSDCKFNTARRFAVSDDKNFLFVADEDDKQITCLEIKTKLKVCVQSSHNRGLQNVRCIAVTKTRLYAATSAGVSVYFHKNGDFNGSYKMLVKYSKHVEHSRGLCLQSFGPHIYLALSIVKNGKDEIAVFSFDEREDF